MSPGLLRNGPGGVMMAMYKKKKKNESKGANTQRGQCQGREEVPKAFSRRDNFHQTRGVGSWVTNLPKEIIRDRVGLGRPLSSKMQ